MDDKQIKKLIQKGQAKAVVDNKNPQTRQAVVTGGTLKVRVAKGDPNGKTNN